MLCTSLHDHLAAHGAVHRDDHGVAVPAHFGGVAAEAASLREGAAVVDLGFRHVVVVTGTDRMAFLQGMLTNDVAALAVGEACPSLLLTIQGRITADVGVWRLDEATWLDVDCRATVALQAALDHLIIADDVVLTPDPTLAMIGLLGAEAGSLFPEGAALAPWSHAEFAVDGVTARVLHADPFGRRGWTFLVSTEDAPALWDRLVVRGARPCGQDAFEVRRIELGIPRIGVDMGEETLAIEMPIMDRISTTKGCYLGQEVVARGTSRGRVNRRLCGLRFEGPPPAPGTALVQDDTRVGHVTSGAARPDGAQAIGMGIVRREHWEPGQELVVEGTNPPTIARVAAWPLA